MTEILLFLMQACLTVGAVFGLWHILGVPHLWGRYGFRRGFTAVLLLFAAEMLTVRPLFSPYWLAGWLFFLPWISVFPALQVRSLERWGIKILVLKSYLLVACAGMMLLTALSVWESSAGVYAPFLRGISFIVLLFSGVICGTYLLYYFVYDTVFSEGDMIPVLQTNQAEAAGYIKEQVGLKKAVIAGILFVLYALLAGGISILGGESYTAPVVALIKYKIFALVVISGYSLWHYGKNCFPFYEYKAAKEYIKEEKRLMKGHAEAVKKIVLDECPETDSDETVILVIGESANRDHMKAFNEGYPEETTPWLSENKEEDGFYLFKNAYSNFPQTIQSLSMYLTNKNQYTEGENTDIVNIIDMARKGGYKTYWLSNQTRTGEYSCFATFVGLGADRAEWTGVPEGDEIRLLDLLKKIPKQGRKFIVLHLMGSHMPYEDRVPTEFVRQRGRMNDTKENRYDTSILYSDYILQSVYEYGKKHLNLQTMIYCADHGENLEYGRATAHFKFDMVRIPMFIYLSEKYRNTYQDKAKNLNDHRDAVFTNDLMFDTVCGIMNLPNNFYKRKYDLSDEQYDLPLETAVTNHGKTKISEDRLS